MLKAHSLLYAVYVCLIVSILCGALLYYSSLYNMLNQMYNTREDLYLQNQSALNFALGNGDITTELTDETGITSSFEMKTHGLLSLLIVNTFSKNDTVTSVHFVGHYSKSQTAMYVSNFSTPLSFSGNVKLIGDKLLPAKIIPEKHINNTLNTIVSTGTINLSESALPEINPEFKAVFRPSNQQKMVLKDLQVSNDSVYYNSFLNKTIEVQLNLPVLHKLTMKGNFMLQATDSIVIGQDNVLQDVIIKAPVIRIAKGFKGNIQAFATKRIIVEDDVKLSYPSVVSVRNDSAEPSEIRIGERSTIYGAVVIFDSPILSIDYNNIIVKEKALIIGDIYSSGKLMVNGSVYGSVYTNRFFSSTLSGTYENCIMNAEIDISKKPDFFVSIPLFKSKEDYYGVFKKVL